MWLTAFGHRVSLLIYYLATTSDQSHNTSENETATRGLPFSTKPDETERNWAIIVVKCARKMYYIAI